MSALEDAIQANRAALLRGDEMALRTVIRGYGPVRRNLIELIIQLVDEATANGAITASKLARLERAQVLLGQVEAELTRLGGSMSSFIVNGQSQAAQLAIKQAAELLQVQGVNIATGFNKLNPRAVQEVIGRMSNGAPIPRFFADLPAKTTQSIKDALIDGVARGINPKALAAQLTKEFDLVGEKILTVTRTEMLNSYRNASLATYRLNEDILSGWVWICALRGSCAACVALSGKEFDLSVEFMPTHPRCRCTCAPQLKDGPKLPVQDGEEWFAKQDAEYQDSILRPSGGEAYRAKEVTLDDFVKLNSNAEWGDSYTQGGLAAAKRNAQANRRSEAA